PPPGHRSPLVGSIGYLAPERLTSRGDARTDVYAAGVVLFETLTRRMPFQGSQEEILRQHAQEPAPRPSTIAAIPKEFDAIVERALAKDLSQRFQTVGEFDGALLDVVPREADVVPTIGLQQALLALMAWENCDLEQALEQAREAASRGRCWAMLRELLEVVAESGASAGH
ncbi:MAG: protein kinase domain-containing protein, partial [Nannocystaceae bacterium]